MAKQATRGQSAARRARITAELDIGDDEAQLAAVEEHERMLMTAAYDDVYGSAG